jgi:exopolysaccharide biosynthesis polyprenyl glycosylphosphotransferase
VIRRYAVGIQFAAALADAAVALLTVVALSLLRFGADWENLWALRLPDPLLFGLGYAALWSSMLWLSGHYRIRSRRTFLEDAAIIARSTAGTAVVVLAMLYLLKMPDVSRLFMLLLFPAQFAAALLLRAPIRFLLLRIWRRGFDPLRILVVGTSARALRFAEQLRSHRELGLHIVGFLSDGSETGAGTQVLGRVEDLPDVLHRYVVDEIAVCLPFREWDKIEILIGLCQDEGKSVRIPIELPERALSRGQVEEIDGVPLYSLVSGPDRLFALGLKRLFDIIAAVFGIVISSPLMLLVGILVLLVDGAPVIFRQCRVGRHGRLFTMLKFRTMTRDAEARQASLAELNEVKGHAFKVRNDPRVTRLGRWLRKTSLDELPQLWNVLVGDMSLVGPRPPLESEVARYDIWHRRRLSMKPGVTGLWQIRGRREPNFDKWVEADLEYIDRWSLWLDLKILASTIPSVMTMSGR